MYYLTNLTNVKNAHYCYTTTSQRLYRWNVTVSGYGPILAMTDLGHTGDYVDTDCMVYALRASINDLTFAKALPHYAPYTDKRTFLNGFAGQFIRVCYRGDDGIKRVRTVKATKKTSVVNNPLCYRVYDASVKGIRTIRLDRLLGVKVRGVEITF